MREAYDAFLQSIVSAELATKNGGFETHRYECACCGEEVLIVAKFSTKVATYFKHHNGNSGIECENYLGNYGITDIETLIRRSNHARAEVYYNSSNKLFYIAIRLSEDDINEYDNKSAELVIKTKNHRPLKRLKINRFNFHPNSPISIYLTEYSNKYYLSNTLDGKEKECEFLKQGNTPTFFKILCKGERFIAKLVHTSRLYTNTRYFVTVQNKYMTPNEISFTEGTTIEETCNFETMNRKFRGYVISIPKKTTKVEKQLNAWGYKIESSETINLLWPPAYLIDEHNIVESDYAFIYSTFNLQNNTNLRAEETRSLTNCVYKIKAKQMTIIYKKNIEMYINKLMTPVINHCEVSTSQMYTDKFIVPDDCDYFLFNRLGVTCLKSGQEVILTPNSYIVKYVSNYPLEYIYPYIKKNLDSDELLHDILLHYKRKETLDFKRLMTFSPSKTVTSYIDRCKTAGSINYAVMRCIMEDLL